jgi:small subunit ribosomal protein S15
MAVVVERKKGLVKDYSRHEGDTGSPEVQVALLTERINHLTDHLKVHKKDFTSRHGLLMMVGQRRRLLKFLEGENRKGYESLISRLGIRK